jgi:hypothetical protein
MNRTYTPAQLARIDRLIARIELLRSLKRNADLDVRNSPIKRQAE